MEQLESYLKAVKLFRNYEDPSEDPVYSEVKAPFSFIAKMKPDQSSWSDQVFWLQVMEINLSTVVPYVSGPKRPQDRVAVCSMKEDFQRCLDQKVGRNPTYLLAPTVTLE